MRLTPTCAVIAAIAATTGVTAAAASLEVTSPAFSAGGAIPARDSAYGANRSPPLRWTPAPGARAYAVIMDDPDARGPAPFVHWIAWNIPASATSLAEGASLGVSGVNGSGRRGYFGPRPPSGVHHYHIRVFALNAALSLAPASDREALDRAMRGHVLATSELVGTYAAPAR